MTDAAAPGLVYTVGHGAGGIDELLERLLRARVLLLADVRTAPRSRRHPHFSQDALAAAVRRAGIQYEHFRGLGGWRRSHDGSPHTALAVPALRGYADHLESDEFARDYARLCVEARTVRTAVMCSETLWWRCHRRILADQLVAEGWEVAHLLAERVERHQLWPLARLDGSRLVYDVGQLALAVVENGPPPSS